MLKEGLVKDLFFIGPLYHLEFPEDLKYLIAMDIDLDIRLVVVIVIP